MPNYVKLSSDSKRTLMAKTLMEIEKRFPFEDDEDFEVFLKCIQSIKADIFDVAHFRALLEISNGKNYWYVIKNIALKGNVDEVVIDSFEKTYLK